MYDQSGAVPTLQLPSSESDFENQEIEVICENCEKELSRALLLRHIGHKGNEACKSYYGIRFDQMKRAS